MVDGVIIKKTVKEIHKLLEHSSNTSWLQDANLKNKNGSNNLFITIVGVNEVCNPKDPQLQDLWFHACVAAKDSLLKEL